MISYPDMKKIKQALLSLEFLAVCDIFPTETTELADVVLPAASFAEKDGTFTSTERRVQLVRRALPPCGECRPEWEVISDLLSRFDVPTDYTSPADVMEEIASVTPIYGGVIYDRLGTDGLQWPCPSRDHPGTGILHAEKFSIGLAKFRPVEHREPIESTDEHYPLLLTTGRSLYHFHTGTMTRRTSLLDREIPGPYVEMNPEDAKKLGVRTGQKVVVESRRGQLCMDAKLTTDIPKGTLFVPFHFNEACANVLTGQAVDPQSKIPEFKVTAARVRRAD